MAGWPDVPLVLAHHDALVALPVFAPVLLVSVFLLVQFLRHRDL